MALVRRIPASNGLFLWILGRHSHLCINRRRSRLNPWQPRHHLRSHLSWRSHHPPYHHHRIITDPATAWNGNDSTTWYRRWGCNESTSRYPSTRHSHNETHRLLYYYYRLFHCVSFSQSLGRDLYFGTFGKCGNRKHGTYPSMAFIYGERGRRWVTFSLTIKREHFLLLAGSFCVWLFFSWK